MSAVKYQTMPPLSTEEYAQLEQSILADGVQVPIIVDESGVVIDGHHRKRIAEQHGLHCPVEVRSMLTDAQKTALSISLNIARRQLSREQKRAIIEAAVKAQPEKPDYQHAKTLGVSNKTVTSVRRELESDWEIPNDIPRVNERGQERPASYAPRSTPVETEGLTVDPDTGEVLDELAPAVEVTRTETFKTTEKRPEPMSPRRRPITDAANDLGWELRKRGEKLERLLQDDRFARNKEEMATHLRGHLEYVIRVCQDSLDHLNK